MREFYGCYLLVSRSEKCKGRTYIGFTVNPKRRIRQHNGLITSGASKTAGYRPWDMVLVVYGFATKIQALQFEWAWQHPATSLAVRSIVERVGKKKLTGVGGKMKLLHEMLNVSPWRYYPLSLQILAPEFEKVQQKCLQLPAHMPTTVAPLEELPPGIDASEAEEEPPPADSPDDSAGSGSEENGNESTKCQVVSEQVASEPGEAMPKTLKGCKPEGGFKNCALCGGQLTSHWLACSCGSQSHPDCLALHFLEEDETPGATMPTSGMCPGCGKVTPWLEALRNAGNFGWKNHTGQRRKEDAARQAAEKAARKAAAAEKKAAAAKESKPPRKGRKARVAAPPDANEIVSEQTSEGEAVKPKRRGRPPKAPSAAAAAAAGKPKRARKKKKGEEQAAEKDDSAAMQQPEAMAAAVPKAAEVECWSFSDSDAAQLEILDSSVEGLSEASPSGLAPRSFQEASGRSSSSVRSLHSSLDGSSPGSVGVLSDHNKSEREAAELHDHSFITSSPAKEDLPIETRLGVCETPGSLRMEAMAIESAQKPSTNPTASAAAPDAARAKRLRSVSKGKGSLIGSFIDLTDSPAAAATPQHVPLRRRLKLGASTASEPEAAADDVIILT